MEKPLPGRVEYTDLKRVVNNEDRPIPRGNKLPAVSMDIVLDSDKNAAEKMRKFEEFKAR